MRTTRKALCHAETAHQPQAGTLGNAGRTTFSGCASRLFRQWRAHVVQTSLRTTWRTTTIMNVRPRAGTLGNAGRTTFSGCASRLFRLGCAQGGAQRGAQRARTTKRAQPRTTSLPRSFFIHHSTWVKSNIFESATLVS